MKNATQLLKQTRVVFHQFALIILLCTYGFTKAHSQTAVVCPQNIDFSFGNFNNWLCYTGDVNSIGGVWAIGSMSPSGPVGGTAPPLGSSRHELTSGLGTDYYGGFTEVAPGGGLFSVRIGNDNTGYEAERIQYKIHVPIGFNNYSFNFKYAVVFEDPGTSHQIYEKPRFQVIAYDSANPLNPIICATQTFIAGQTYAQPFQTSAVQSAQGLYPLYLPWTTGNLNLSGQGGKTMIIEVTTSDCTLGGHFGYGYFDVISCGQFAAAITYCNLDLGLLTLQGPPGYQKYEWFNQNFTTRLNAAPYNHQSINVPAPTVPQYYNLVLTPYGSNGCPDTIRTKILADFGINATPDSLCNTLGKPVQLNVITTGGVGGFDYKWTSSNTPIVPANIPNPIVNPVSTDYIVVTVTDSNGCFRQDTVKIENPDFKVNLGPDLVTCLGTPINLKPVVTPAGAPGYVFSWIPATNISNPTILDPTFTPSVVGTQQYVLRVDSGICAASDTMNIKTLPNNFLVADAAICEGQDFTPLVQGDPAFTYTWQFTGPQGFPGNPVLDFTMPPTSGSDQKPRFTGDTTRTFTITARYPTCPAIVNQLTVRVEPLPRVDLGDDTMFKCVYSPLYINTKVTPTWFGNYSFKWSENQYLNKLDVPVVAYNGPTDSTLYVTVRTPLGCKGIDSVYVHVFPGNFATLSPIDPQICPRNSVELTAGGGVSYRWTPELYLSNTKSPKVASSPASTTTYSVYVTDKNGCVDTAFTTVTVNPEAVLTLPDSVVLYPGESYQLSPQGNMLYYSWFPTVGLYPNASISNPVATPTVNTLYHVSGTTEGGCAAKDSIYVIVREESAIDVANAFSPGSEPNSYFKVSHLGTATLRYFRIYDRWGLKVFESNDINKGWDGSFNGSPQPVGVYVYTVEAVTNKGKVFSKQGNVTLLR
jgi:gliding motility-associated-like protein